jgi:tetratricopeptide (TPR) repeat protein
MDENASDHFRQALAKFRSRDVKGGLSDLEKAIQLDPSRWEYFWTRGAFNYRRHHYISAESDLSKAIDLCPDEKKVGKVYRRRMYCHRSLDQFNLMIEDATWLVEHGFADANIYEWRGWGRYTLGNIEGAIDDYSRAVELIPLDYLTRLGRASVYYWSKRYSEALEDANYLLNLISQPPYRDFKDDSLTFGIYQFRALIFYHLGDFEKSLRDYNRANQIANGTPFPDVQSYVDSIKDDIGNCFSLMPYAPAPWLRRREAQDE